MRNPWSKLPVRPPFVLAVDKPYVEVFNRAAAPEHHLKLQLLPEPFNGDINSPILVLLLNPGVSRGDFRVNANPNFRRLALAALRRPTHVRCHSFLAPDMKAPGTDWWLRATRPLIERFGRPKIAASILAVEYFPYHSRKYAHSALRLPSQQYTFALVRRAVRRGATIVLARGAAQWFGAVPELASYKSLVRLRTARRTSISPRNLEGTTTFARICTLLT